MPFGMPIPPSPATSKALLAAFAERGITFIPNRLVRALDPQRHAAVLDDGSELPYDLFLGIPKHRVPEVVAASGMTENGWIPVNPKNLETRFPGVYAVGDVTSVGTPKAGVFAEGAARIVAAEIIADCEGRRTASRRTRARAPATSSSGQGGSGVWMWTSFRGHRPRGATSRRRRHLSARRSSLGPAAAPAGSGCKTAYPGGRSDFGRLPKAGSCCGEEQGFRSLFYLVRRSWNDARDFDVKKLYSTYT